MNRALPRNEAKGVRGNAASRKGDSKVRHSIAVRFARSFRETIETSLPCGADSKTSLQFCNRNIRILLRDRSRKVIASSRSPGRRSATWRIFAGPGRSRGITVTRTVNRQGQQREIGALKQSIVAAI
jgi:hypothetical protein